MKISTRVRYGVKAMIELAINLEQGRCISLKNIATRQGIPENYLEQLMIILKKADLVKSVRGVQGGYILNKLPQNITIGYLINVLEGSLSISECFEDESKKTCALAKCSKCAAKKGWQILNDKFAETANSITLYDLIDCNN